LIWNCSCEASLYSLKSGKHLSAITENVREIYHIRDGKGKDDTSDPDLVVSETDKEVRVAYLLEQACQQMFGAWKGDNIWGGQVDMDLQFEWKKCQLGLANSKMEDYYHSLSMIKDVAALLEKK
jgi:hypothetical protein